MPRYDIHCADNRTVTIGIMAPDDPANLLLRNLKRYHGLDPHQVMAEICSGYTSTMLTWDIAPDHLLFMLHAFTAGYEMADRSNQQAG